MERRAVNFRSGCFRRAGRPEFPCPRNFGAIAVRDVRGNRTIQAVGMAAAMVWNIKSVLNGCETQAVESGEWLQYCVRFAERLERDGRTILSNVIGLKLQETMYSISGDEEKEAAAEQRLRLIRNSMRNGQSEDGQVLLSRDDRVLADYITEWATFGELRAVQFLRNEVERLRNVSGYDPCRM